MQDLAEQRHKVILEMMHSEAQVLVSSLAKHFDVSEMTIRRDLKTLEELGLAMRVHGGAVPMEKSRFTSRLAANAPAKARAVSKLVEQLPREGCIYFDGSTTILHLVKHLKGCTGLQVATNNVETFNRLAAVKGPTPILIGGALDLRTDNLIGPLAMRSLEALAFEKSFFSAWGLSEKTGLNEVTVEDAGVKELVAARSRHVYVAVDHSKLGVVAGGIWQPGDATVLATDCKPEDPKLDPFRSMFGAIL